MEIPTFTCQLCKESRESLDFYIVHGEERCYFQFPRDMDHSYMVAVIKARLSIHGAFCLCWNNPNETKVKTKKKQRRRRPSTSSSTLSTCGGGRSRDQVYIHSTNITAETMREFRGETFFILPSANHAALSEISTNLVNSSSMKLTQRNMMREKHALLIDCPP